MAEKEGYTPDSRKAHQSKNNSAEKSALTSEKRSNNVKTKDSYASPVEGAYNYEKQRKFIEHKYSPFVWFTIFIPNYRLKYSITKENML